MDYDFQGEKVALKESYFYSRRYLRRDLIRNAEILLVSIRIVETCYNGKIFDEVQQFWPILSDVTVHDVPLKMYAFPENPDMVAKIYKAPQFFHSKFSGF